MASAGKNTKKNIYILIYLVPDKKTQEGMKRLVYLRCKQFNKTFEHTFIKKLNIFIKTIGVFYANLIQSF